MFLIGILVTLLIIGGALFLYFSKREMNENFGVFTGLTGDEIDKIDGYDVVVIDAQYATKGQISKLQDKGTIVYSYINVGGIENFRDYYDEYKDLALADYENWNEEQWVDVTSESWQDLIAILRDEMLDKGVDGFFVDNCDVYYMFPTEEVFCGLTDILEGLKGTGKDVFINGGDTYVTEYLDREGSLDKVCNGVNQETVFSSIDFENERFGKADDENYEYYMEYLERVEDTGGKIYLLEYTKDDELAEVIISYCKEHNWGYYISDSIELTLD
jgi:hypothetical protein